MHILVYQNDRSRNASSDRKMNHIILLVNVQTFQKYNYYYYFLFIGWNHKMWVHGADSVFLTDDHIASNDKMYITIQCNFIIDYIWE